MRRALLSAAVLTVLVAAGSAAGATVRGTSASETLRGTNGPDRMYGGGGRDTFLARGGDDLIVAGREGDVVRAGRGNDRVVVQDDDGIDRVYCGPGRDLVNLDAGDRAFECELVARRISRLPPTSVGQRGTEVEPDSFSHGSRVVAAFQAGRFVDGGAAAIGWATSTNGGRSWRGGMLPGLSPASGDVVTDPAVAYDAAHRTWLISSLRGVEPEGSQIVVSRSRTGLTWSRPVVVAGGPTADLDKEWIVCDNGASSRFRGRCYVSYVNFETGAIETRRSTNGGQTWSAAQPISVVEPSPSIINNGAMPLVRPDGTLILAYVAFTWPDDDVLVAARSTNGGVSFGDPVMVAPLAASDVWGVRSAPLPSGDVDAGGRVYLAWHDCRFGENCTNTGIVLATSPDGVRWGAPTLVPTRMGGSGDSFIPGLDVAPGSRGANARLAITYHFLRNCTLGLSCPGIEVGMVESGDGGRSWKQPRRLSAQPMKPAWIAESSIGRMVGDYISTSWAGGRPVGVFSLATSPTGGRFRQSIFAARLPAK